MDRTREPRGPVRDRGSRVIVQEPPYDSASKLRIPEDFDAALARHPKEIFEALVRLMRLRRAPDLYTRIGEKASLRALKRESAILRIATAISSWFPPSGVEAE